VFINFYFQRFERQRKAISGYTNNMKNTSTDVGSISKPYAGEN